MSTVIRRALAIPLSGALSAYAGRRRGGVYRYPMQHCALLFDDLQNVAKARMISILPPGYSAIGAARWSAGDQCDAGDRVISKESSGAGADVNSAGRRGQALVMQAIYTLKRGDKLRRKRCCRKSISYCPWRAGNYYGVPKFRLLWPDMKTAR